MKVAFLAVIVFVLSLQGSEALPSGGLTVIVDGLLTLLNGALITVRNTVQRVLDSKYPSQQCKVVDVLPDVHKVFAHALNYLSTTVLNRIVRSLHYDSGSMECINRHRDVI